jgi:L-2-hydroxyglutarate oxidase LhgO
MSDVDEVDTCIIGAGVVGLAIARELTNRGGEVLILESSPKFGEGISSRNSEVIHAGIYYPKDSLKATLCVRGKKLLYEYCAQRNVAHRRLGKLIVATNSEEESQLETIRDRANGNDVDDIDFVSSSALKDIEPAVQATAALLSPSTGIISAHDLMTAFLGDIEANGGSLACRASVTSVNVESSGFLLNCDIDGHSYRLKCRRLVNSAGLNAQDVAGSISGFNPGLIPKQYLCKGNYFIYQARNPFFHLIYPVPDTGGAGLGVHATIDMGGQVKFGPDVEYIEEADYSVSETSFSHSIEAIRRYFPSLDDRHLAPGYAGIRPKLQGPGDSPEDFIIQGFESHEINGLVNLYGIESPGLTSSMAIAETVSTRLDATSG